MEVKLPVYGSKDKNYLYMEARTKEYLYMEAKYLYMEARYLYMEARTAPQAGSTSKRWSVAN